MFDLQATRIYLPGFSSERMNLSQFSAKPNQWNAREHNQSERFSRRARCYYHLLLFQGCATNASSGETKAALVCPQCEVVETGSTTDNHMTAQRITLERPGAKNVCIAGSCNDWAPDATPLQAAELIRGG